MAESEAGMPQSPAKDERKPQEPSGYSPLKTVVLTILVLVCVGAGISIIVSIRDLDEFIKLTDQGKPGSTTNPEDDPYPLPDGTPNPNVVKIDPQDGPKPPTRPPEKPKTRYPDAPAASKTAQRASTLDLRNPAALKIARDLWKHDEAIVRLTLIKKMIEADNDACAAWLREIVEGEGAKEKAEDIRGHAIAALSKMKNKTARKYFLSLDGYPEEVIRCPSSRNSYLKILRMR